MARCDFRWVLEGKLAGSSRPGLLAAMEEDMAFLRGQGIRLVVTLTEAPLHPPASSFGLEGLHFPIPDMGTPPTLGAVAALCARILESLERAEPVLLHCKAGIGRTGTMLACCLVAMGCPPAKALLAVRVGAAGPLQTEGQVRFVHEFAELLSERDGALG
jgi:atypical dual specificity phosphatase